MYKQLRSSTFSQQTIASSFRGAGLIPFDPERVLSRLTFTKPLTPTPPRSQSPTIQSSPWQSGTPQNTKELAKQLQLVQDQSDELAKLARGAQLAMETAVILAVENAELRESNKRLQEKKKRQTGAQLQERGPLRVGEALRLVESRMRGTQDEAAEDRERAPRMCGRCHLPGHNVRTCPN
jgi:hypothetical protein